MNTLKECCDGYLLSENAPSTSLREFAFAYNHLRIPTTGIYPGRTPAPDDLASLILASRTYRHG